MLTGAKMKAEFTQQVRDYLQKNFLFDNAVTFTDKDSLLKIGIIDSTGVLELVTFVQETYKIEIKDEEITPENLDSVENLSAFIERKTCAGNKGIIA
jgi:acyl carrier protein